MTAAALGAVLNAPHLPYPRSQHLTLADAWRATSGQGIDDEMLMWPPDVFALTDVLLERTEAYRFVVSPPAAQQWRPLSDPGWDEMVASAARSWWDWLQNAQGDLPHSLAREWTVIRDGESTPLDDVGSGRAWRVCEALLTLHAVADQACAPASAEGDPTEAMTTRVRELLATTGSMARIDRERLRVLPRYRTSSGGISVQSISRYASVTGPGVDVTIHRLAGRRPTSRYPQLNILLLPWPLSISAGDFRPVPGSVHEREVEPFGYFEFNPSASLDMSLTEGVLATATSQVDQVDMVVLPEGSLSEDDLPRLEESMARHGAEMLVAGLRPGRSSGPEFSSNWVQFAAAFDGDWSHYRQEKHHRWALDRTQIEQYHLEHVLDPDIRWWEAMQVPRKGLEVIERPDGHTVASLICEDLAHIDDTIDLLRAIGPSLVLALLLDGPQLASRWTSRYAAILADDPGSAVLTLSSYGMVRRSWRSGQARSSTIALWKDRTNRHEITLAPDAQGVLLSAQSTPTLRRAADGRRPRLDVAELSLAGITQISAT